MRELFYTPKYDRPVCGGARKDQVEQSYLSGQNIECVGGPQQGEYQTGNVQLGMVFFSVISVNVPMFSSGKGQ